MGKQLTRQEKEKLYIEKMTEFNLDGRILLIMIGI